MLFLYFKKMKRCFKIKLLILLLFIFLYDSAAYAISEIRPSILAGTWYPADKNELLEMINKFLASAHIPVIKGKIKAIIVPHAGYVYSGSVAAYAFKAIKGKMYKRVVMIGPCHRSFFYGVSVNLQKGYKTPLGIVPVDIEFAKKLIQESDQIRYVPMAHACEHCLEIQLPFLQVVLKKGFKLVPILMGEQDIYTCKKLADAILRLLKNDKEPTLILASSDLSHYHSYKEAVHMDRILIQHVKQIDPDGLNTDTINGICEACGKGAIMTALFIAQRLGVKKALLLKYANSGDVTGDHSRVLGYMSAVLST
ncbi:MAG: AmmeMemoRadiSam system protein B [Deltaproteobacteria bacterium]|nr:MAG: AmmeMemoRadiSam system protein B [Deltaproteobacteria bacterium]